MDVEESDIEESDIVEESDIEERDLMQLFAKRCTRKAYMEGNR